MQQRALRSVRDPLMSRPELPSCRSTGDGRGVRMSQASGVTEKQRHPQRRIAPLEEKIDIGITGVVES